MKKLLLLGLLSMFFASVYPVIAIAKKMDVGTVNLSKIEKFSKENPKIDSYELKKEINRLCLSSLHSNEKATKKTIENAAKDKSFEKTYENFRLQNLASVVIFDSADHRIWMARTHGDSGNNMANDEIRRRFLDFTKTVPVTTKGLRDKRSYSISNSDGNAEFDRLKTIVTTLSTFDSATLKEIDELCLEILEGSKNYIRTPLFELGNGAKLIIARQKGLSSVMFSHPKYKSWFVQVAQPYKKTYPKGLSKDEDLAALKF